MHKTIQIAVATAAISAFACVGTASASEGNHYGSGCRLANNSTYDNPGAMLQYLSERDGNPRATVDKYPNSFSSVGDLISKKCGV